MQSLKKKYLIKSEKFLGHSDVAPLRRKTDPGENFWKKLSTHRIGKWYIGNKEISKLKQNE